MAKEKKGTKKATVKAAKKPVAKKVATKRKVVEKNTTCMNKFVPIIYMFLLILGVSLIFVSLALLVAGYIDTKLMVTCIGISIISIVASMFVRRFCE